MASPTITVSGITFSFNSTDCKSVKATIGANLDHDAMPLSTAESALLFDVNGVLKTILVQGELTLATSSRVSSGTSVTTINEQRQWLEQNLNANQAGGSFDSNYTSTWNGTAWFASPIMFATLEFDEQEGLPNSLPFTLTLFVGSV